MGVEETREKVAAYHAEIVALRQQLREAQKSLPPEVVEDYQFQGPEGAISLAALFGDKETLFVVHNMGQSCAYCTLWADGLNGVLGHLEDRAAFVISSPDGPEAQAAFKASRGWNFTMVSHQGTGFAEAMGYGGENGWLPGVSVFKQQNGGVVRVSNTPFGPGDDYCAVWNLFDLIPEGSDGWQPRFSY